MSDCRQRLEEFSGRAMPGLNSLGPTFRSLIGHRILMRSIASEPVPSRRKLLDVLRLATTTHLSYKPECFLYPFLRFGELPFCDLTLLHLVRKLSILLKEYS